MRHTKCCVSSYPTDFLILFSTTHLRTAELRLTAGANRLLSPVWIRSVCSLSLFDCGSKAAWNPPCLSAWPQFCFRGIMKTFIQASMTHQRLPWHRQHAHVKPRLRVSLCTPFEGIISMGGQRNTVLILTDHSSWYMKGKKTLTQHLYGTYKHGMQRHGTLMRTLTGYVRYISKRDT